MNPDFDWHEIDRQTLTLRGISRSQTQSAPTLTFIAESVLSKKHKLVDYAAVGLEVTIEIPRDGFNKQPFTYHWIHGCYANLQTFLRDLQLLRDGKLETVEFGMEGFELSMYEHTMGARSGLLVELLVSNFHEDRTWPWRKRRKKMNDWLLADNASAFSLRCNFLTSIGDPPFVESFIRDLRELLEYLEIHSA